MFSRLILRRNLEKNKILRRKCVRTTSCTRYRRRYSTTSVSSTGPEAEQWTLNLSMFDNNEKPLMSQVPGLVFGESGKLASYYWLYANQQKAREAVEQDFDKILKIRQNEKELNTFNHLIYSTVYDPVERAKAFANTSVTKISFNPVTIKILGDLSMKNRQFLLWSIIEDFKDLMKSYRREVDVTLVFPKVPSPDYFELILSKIENEYLPENSKMNLAIEIDESILRGYKVRMGHTSVDNTWNADYQRFLDIEEQIKANIDKKNQSMYPTVYNVKLPTIEEVSAEVIKLMEKIVTEKEPLSIKVDTRKTLKVLEKTSKEIDLEKMLFD